jgi:two-component system, OmpR family, sensor histidine kinase BaeS
MRKRFFLAFALVALVAIASVLVILRQSTVLEVSRYMTRQAMGVDDLASQLEAYYQQFGTWQGADMILTTFSQGQGHGMGMMMGGRHLRLADVDGNLVADNQGAPTGALTRQERSAAIVLHDAQGKTIGYLLAEAGQAMMGVTQPSEQELLNALLRAGLIGGAVSGALALLVASLLAFGLLRPIEDLTHAAVKMSGGDLGQRVKVRGKDQVSTLGSAFNKMAASLQRVEQNRRAMTADIAHELRTPIAIQRAHLEALQDGVYALTLENLQPILEQTELLTRLVDDLRTLALADAGELRLERTPTDLSALTCRVVDRFRPEAEARGLQLLIQCPPVEQFPPVSVDPQRVEQILNNLVSNALRYTPEGGSVSVDLHRNDKFVELSIADTGPGIPTEDMPRVFERFYRGDRSRSREQGGTGLGLAIARQLALAHGGDLTAENRIGGGAVFTLSLPC